MTKWIFYICSLISLALFFYWGISENQKWEPWIALLSAVLCIIGLFFQEKELGKLNSQSSLFSFFSSAKIKNPVGSNKQVNIFGIKNHQEIEYDPQVSEKMTSISIPVVDKESSKLDFSIAEGVKDIIGEGEIEKAIENLSSILKQDFPTAYNELLGFQTQLSQLEYERRQFLISEESYRINRQRLNHGIIGLLDKLST